jgi:hypothetical protein
MKVADLVAGLGSKADNVNVLEVVKYLKESKIARKVHLLPVPLYPLLILPSLDRSVDTVTSLPSDSGLKVLIPCIRSITNNTNIVII